MVLSSAALTLFIDGLQSLGFQPVKLTDRSDCVIFDYCVESGKFAGKTVRLDSSCRRISRTLRRPVPRFPQHSRALPERAHPTGGIHQQNSEPFQTGQGGNGSTGRGLFRLGRRTKNGRGLHEPYLASMGYPMSRATHSTAMTGAIDTTAREHLLRPRRQEDICFALWFPSAGRSRTTALIHKLLLPLPGERNVHGNVSSTRRFLNGPWPKLRPAGQGGFVA